MRSVKSLLVAVMVLFLAAPLLAGPGEKAKPKKQRKAPPCPVAKMIEGPVTHMVTASALQMHPVAKVFIDGPAASHLQMREYYEWIQSKKPDAPES